MKFNPPLIRTRLVKRYKRFLADVEFPDGKVTTVHCANPGSMLGLTEPGIEAWISDSCNPKRKLQYSLELVKIGNELVGVNTNHPNRLAREAIEGGRIPQLDGYAGLKTEVRYGTNSRIDILLTDDQKPDTYVEVKNVHFVRNPGIHEFPDSVTARGAKHLHELAEQVKRGNMAFMLYVIQRGDGDAFRIAGDLDPQYKEAFDHAVKAGVQAIAIKCDVNSDGIEAVDLVSVDG